MKDKLTQIEIDQRVAVLKRFKTLLQEQRKKFNDYLVVLETQERSIAEENIDAILHHTKLEQSIIGDIFTIQKVIDPIEKMYEFSQPCNDGNEVIKLKNDLDKLQNQVLIQNKKNRELLKSRMTDIREEIISISPIHTNIPAAVFAKETVTSSLVDISI